MSGKNGKSGNSVEGNTNHRIVPGKYWCFTLNNYEDADLGNLAKEFELRGIKYTIGEEVGESGTKHLQGFITSEKIIRPGELIKNKRIHWEKAKASKEANIKYCSKDGKVTTNMLTTDKKRELLKIPSYEDLYDWQKEVLSLLEEQNDRQILWCWDLIGNTGKTTLAKLLVFEKNAYIIDGKKSDILYGVSCFVGDDEEKTFIRKFIFILDLSRSLENYVSYDSIEKIKNGFWYSTKYECKMIMIPPPKVLIFANFKPDKSKLSEDRWVIYTCIK